MHGKKKWNGKNNSWESEIGVGRGFQPWSVSLIIQYHITRVENLALTLSKQLYYANLFGYLLHNRLYGIYHE